MKKIIAGIVALIMMMSMCVAEGIDLSQYSLDELVGLEKQIEEEIRTRVDEEYHGICLEEGFYTVGMDVPEGNYRYIVIEQGSRPAITLRDKFGNVLDSIRLEESDDDRRKTISAKAGNTIYVNDAVIILIPIDE